MVWPNKRGDYAVSMVLAFANRLEILAQYALGSPNKEGSSVSLNLTQRRYQRPIKTWLKAPVYGLRKWWWD
jgi:hypothetical protein